MSSSSLSGETADPRKMRAVFNVEELGRLACPITLHSLREQWQAFSKPRPVPYTREQFFEAMEKDTFSEVEDFFWQHQEDPNVKALLGEWQNKQWRRELPVKKNFKIFSRIFGGRIGEFHEQACRQMMEERVKIIFRTEKLILERFLQELQNADCGRYRRRTIGPPEHNTRGEEALPKGGRHRFQISVGQFGENSGIQTGEDYHR